MNRLLNVSAAALLSALPFAAQADCGIAESGSVRILANDFGALDLVMDRAASCASDGVTVSINQTEEHKNLQVPALSIDPAEYTVAVIANNSLPPLLNEDLVQPLDELVAEYGQQLTPSQLIRIDGKVMAIAFMVNGMHLFTRSDILEEAGIEETPTTWAEVLEAAEAIRSAGILEYPLAGAYAPGWELAEEFVNMYTATGEPFFKPGTAEPAINSAAGVEVLETMKALTEYMDPDYLSIGSLEASKMWGAGEVAIMNLWASQAGPLIDAEGDYPEVAPQTVLTAAPTLGEGEIPSGALFWDGFSVAANISDEDAAASFQAMMHAIAPDLATEHPSGASWMIDGYVPTANAVGIMANVAEGGRSYPTLPYMGLMHSALGTELVDFLQGNETAEEALAGVEAAYTAAAQETGFLQ
ncbi:carbohydrate ABC transporter substrate-binding protein, CUT1 family [Pseudooceanicola antarcticus]|uniref:Carbohydrate ABC transporter substrate-binding protein, CUT1 family n=1 Tax=Pseudooceanicola antarcticus TaxID=1247613 RepID=A0A285IER8_9RHOB|nr:extracellular solute-binding protein [Pseudooceanicola antarcticus]PJE29146.1 sugar ABC transporter substrate-binding protein [Pseudooceanicola antarcticus]SNY46488.1 carbohydrate ABC transporter substrate-binding protein, CUT1 family [Pseudooceanicola antarcticus]